MYVVPHKTVCYYLYSIFISVSAKDFKIIYSVFVIEKYCLLIISPLCYVMWVSFCAYSGDPRHECYATQKILICQEIWEVSLCYTEPHLIYVIIYNTFYLEKTL